MNEATHTIDKFDRTFGALHDVSLRAKPTTIENIEPITGRVETYVIQTMRHAERGDYIFVKRMDESGVVRLALPPAVARAIASQRDALTKRSRSNSSKAAMRARMENGFVPSFKKKAKKA
jgi:2-methylisocitrate lyase-like PEP mutase family enzyme